MSAVSKRSTPASSAASTTPRVPSRSSRRPKLLQPRPTTDTRRPPSLRVSTSGLQPLVDQPARDRDRRRHVQVGLAAHDRPQLVAREPAHVLQLGVAGGPLPPPPPRRAPH